MKYLDNLKTRLIDYKLECKVICPEAYLTDVEKV